MAAIIQSIKQTEETLKLDIDSDVPEWRRLQRVFNFLYCFPDAQVEEHPHTTGIHLKATVPSRLVPRRAFGDCKGRLLWSEDRGGDIIFQKKGTFKIQNIKGERRVIYTVPPTSYDPIEAMNLLALPFTSKLPRGVFRKK